MAVARSGARRLTGADGVTFVVKEGGYCHYADEDAIAPLWKGRRFPLDQCISGWAMTRRQCAVVPDVYADARIPHDVYRSTFVRSLAIVPIRPEDPVGAIGAYWAEVHEATPDELDLLQAIANGASLAMANVLLYRDLEEAARRERTARLAAEEGNRLMDQLLATVSHELRTPLGVIQGWLWQARREGVKPDVVQRALTVIDRNVALQARLVDDLLDASRAVAGKLSLRRRVLDLQRVCSRVVDLGRAPAASKGVRLTEASDGDALLVDGDAGRLQQAVWSLVDNAIKFTGSGGSVTVVSNRTGNRAHVAVTDTGVGIAPAFLPLVFDPFRQGDSSMTREHGGLGLGLTIVKQIVMLHGGEVRAESAGEGLGTTVTIDLPVAALDTRATEEDRTAPALLVTLGAGRASGDEGARPSTDTGREIRNGALATDTRGH